MSRAIARRDNSGGGGIFVYSCSHTVKTIAFKRKLPGRTRSSYGPEHEQQCFVIYKDTRRSQVFLGLIKQALQMF